MPLCRLAKRTSFLLQFAVDELNKHYSSLNFVLTLIRRKKTGKNVLGEGPDFCSVWSRDSALPVAVVILDID